MGEKSKKWGEAYIFFREMLTSALRALFKQFK